MDRNHDHDVHDDGDSDSQQNDTFATLLIQDMDGWLRQNGLRSADHLPDTFGDALMSSMNQSEIKADIRAGEKHQEEIHASIFRRELQAEAEQISVRQKFLDSWQGEEIEIVSSQQKFSVPLHRLAAECDTIFALASSRRHMQRLTCQEKKCSDDHLYANEEEETAEEQKQGSKVTLTLDDYPATAVREFLALALGEKKFSEIDETQKIVDCCFIGHYLQCPRIVEGSVQILLESIDSDNCSSLCQMADQLKLPDLFERALFHMLNSLDDLETQEVYEDFSPELKVQIAEIRSILATPGYQKDRRCYFTTLDEYIAIFSESVQYYRERLEEAKEQNRGGRFTSYAQSKIEKQEVRVQTMNSMLQEQKRLFGRRLTRIS
mmetsp:Transcript_41377/g.96973  ORF Transcript_41377/g.96973 Transcript_41377/m.96973 type:complete len:378 (-) Transcript_41377:172-1305(-)